MLDQISLAQMLTRNTKAEKGNIPSTETRHLRQPKRSNCGGAADPGDKEKVKGIFPSGADQRSKWDLP